MFAVGQHHERSLFAVEKLFDDDFVAGGAETSAHENLIDGGFRFCQGRADRHPFAGGEAVGFDDVGRFLSRQILLGGCSVAECREDGGWNSVGVKDFLSEGFAAFELGGGFVWPENSQTARFKKIDNAECQRQLRANDGEVDPFCFCKLGETIQMLWVDRYAFG